MCRRECYAHNAKEMKQIGGTVFELASLAFECELVIVAIMAEIQCVRAQLKVARYL
jgi:hypothetical protein